MKNCIIAMRHESRANLLQPQIGTTHSEAERSSASNIIIISDKVEAAIGGNTQLSTESRSMNSVPESTESKLFSSIFGSSTISLSSDDSVSSVPSSESEETESKSTMAAASAAAAWMSRGVGVTGLGSSLAIFGKLRMAALPLMHKAATSCARAAISGVAKVPSQIRDFLRGSRISETHLPQFRIRERVVEEVVEASAIVEFVIRKGMFEKKKKNIDST
ncbi:hypothetical protein Ahy_B08g094447 [Arachis hypogaea]|uniref:Uncharacterized protein n=1 Tax=Arachis hypogaea TaxID=3818 RepID=A0A444Y984_ARAHY|nr:hypothetical protein Ahy_B08g094447 [Arachis hypogaea]